MSIIARDPVTTVSGRGEQRCRKYLLLCARGQLQRSALELDNEGGAVPRDAGSTGSVRYEETLTSANLLLPCLIVPVNVGGP